MYEANVRGAMAYYVLTYNYIFITSTSQSAVKLAHTLIQKRSYTYIVHSVYDVQCTTYNSSLEYNSISLLYMLANIHKHTITHSHLHTQTHIYTQSYTHVHTLIHPHVTHTYIH